jgi:hypothetical protein
MIRFQYNYRSSRSSCNLKKKKTKNLKAIKDSSHRTNNYKYKRLKLLNLLLSNNKFSIQHIIRNTYPMWYSKTYNGHINKLRPSIYKVGRICICEDNAWCFLRFMKQTILFDKIL